MKTGENPRKSLSDLFVKEQVTQNPNVKPAKKNTPLFTILLYLASLGIVFWGYEILEANFNVPNLSFWEVSVLAIAVMILKKIF